ncbi:MAG TPA: tRNA (adenosine(37)-N6)-threonylcarbamoyltransferase complex ATPase subunit type 1 TsaE [Erysipelothrix sp.]|nr:tRNA (adenosine(37)-N6)-threonylcarbamoyltransferase complex ATPase subunit type 1 TsaE [Erysipelothrix sp.]
MKINKYETNNINETLKLGESFAQGLEKGCVIVLSGDLGVGKTAFTKGIALGLGIEDTITSPTFTLLKEYEGRLDLKHIDAYRLEGLDSDSLGLFDLIDDHSVVVLEWGEFLNDLNFKADYAIKIDFLGENQRDIEIEDLR